VRYRKDWLRKTCDYSKDRDGEDLSGGGSDRVRGFEVSEACDRDAGLGMHQRRTTERKKNTASTRNGGERQSGSSVSYGRRWGRKSWAILLHARGHYITSRPIQVFPCRQLFAESHVTESRQLDERPPHGVDQMVFDEQTPEAIGSLVEIRHRQIGS